MSDDTLGPLSDGPLPPLAPAAAVRARGEQRRRRARTALAGAGAGSLAIVLAAVTAYALGAPDGRDTVRPAPLASTAPSVQEEPLQAALLDPEDVQGRVDVEGRWSLRATEDLPFDLLQDVCGRSSVGRDAALRFLDGPDGYAVGEHLAVHADATEAAQALSAEVAALRGCTEGGVSYRVADGSARVVGERLEGESVTPFSLERVGRVVVTVVLPGPAAMAPRLADAAAAEVRAVFPDEAPPPAAPVGPEQLLDAATAERILGAGSWTQDQTDRQDLYPALPGCPGREVPPAEAGRARGLASTSDRAAGHEVLRYADADTAQRLFAAQVLDLQECAVRPLDSDDGTHAYEVVRGLAGEGPARSYALLTVTSSCADCPPVRTSLALSLVGRHVSLVTASGAETADLPALAYAADARVRGKQAPASPATTGPARPAADLLLTVADADRAEPGDWKREGQDVEGPLLDPCTGGTAYPRDADVVDSATTELVARREAGGTTVVQTVARYSDPAAARDAFDGYERAVRACPVKQEETPELPGNRRTHEVVEQADDDGLRTAYVRSESTCDTCASGYTYYAVQQAGDVVSVLLVAQGEDGDPGVRVLRPFARVAGQRLG